uniref:NADH dehydrogenase subunit 4L n=1 Tax=Strongyloides vituli TaxID=553196 RepID=UPI0021B68F2E|nr:NADH dehydrogenase subunit 4L [Strongyloides vituli]UWI71779.1 NADH dehydrogenase subunit 4L [Strongyloides vituli]
MLLYFFFSLLTFWYKGNRFIFVLIGIEFLVMNVFFILGYLFSAMGFFIVLCMSVVSSVLGLVLMVTLIKFYGNDNCLF